MRGILIIGKNPDRDFSQPIFRETSLNIHKLLGISTNGSSGHDFSQLPQGKLNIRFNEGVEIGGEFSVAIKINGNIIPNNSFKLLSEKMQNLEIGHLRYILEVIE